MNQQILIKIAPLIMFFSLPAKQQMEVLPILKEKRRYDFPDGDLITSSALEVLVNAYAAQLNSISIRLDEASNKDFSNIIEQLSEVAGKILEAHFKPVISVNYLESPNCENIRYLSQTLQQQLQILTEVNADVLSGCIDYWLQP